MIETTKRLVSKTKEYSRVVPGFLNEVKAKTAGRCVLRWLNKQDEVNVYVDPHSHLDYAWYLEREASKMREVEAFIKTLLVKTFTLEQMVTAEEFVDGAGERLKDDLLQMISEGRLELIGMYSQPDIFLSPQELRFWNYEFGEKIARKLGGTPPEIEYLPDSFGGDENTPMVMAEADKKALVTMRGFQHRWPLFNWESPDGSKMPTFIMQGGYGNAGNLTEVHGVDRDSVSAEEYYEKQVDHATEVVWSHLKKYGKRYKKANLSHILLMNGNDFTRPDQDLVEVLAGVQERMREKIPNFSIKASTLGEYVTNALASVDVDKLPTYKGEMRSGFEHPILRGIDSARMELKQRMHQVETRIYESGALISLLILARNAGLVTENDHAAWQQVEAWASALKKTLIVGSHDTISGCGADRTYDLAKSLMTGAYGAVNQAARNSIAALANRHDNYGWYQHKEHAQSFANLLPYDRTVLVELPMQGELENDRGLTAIITYEDGREAAYPAQITQKVDTRYAVCAVPMTGMSSVQVRLEAHGSNQSERHDTQTRTFETDNYSLDVLPNGTLNITDRRTGTQMTGLVFEDQGDRGDEYNFCQIDGDTVRTTADSEAAVSIVSDGQVFTEIEITTQLVVPDGLDGPEGTVREVTTRSTNMVTLPISTKVRMYKDPGIDRIEFATTVDNTARDHRLRVRFDTPNAGETVHAKEPFGMTERGAVPIKGGWGWKEPHPVATSHNQGVITAGNTALFNRGLAEYQALPDENGNISQIALTLFRSVGFLSRGNLSSRPGWAGPGDATPEAQMIGRRTYEYAVNFNGQTSAGDVIAESKDYFHHAEHGFAGANINGLFHAEMSRKVEMSALRPTLDGEAVIVRFSNPNDEPATIKLSGIFEKAERATFDGKAREENTDMHEFELRPRGMVSIRLS